MSLSIYFDAALLVALPPLPIPPFCFLTGFAKSRDTMRMYIPFLHRSPLARRGTPFQWANKVIRIHIREGALLARDLARSARCTFLTVARGGVPHS